MSYEGRRPIFTDKQQREFADLFDQDVRSARASIRHEEGNRGTKMSSTERFEFVQAMHESWSFKHIDAVLEEI